MYVHHSGNLLPADSVDALVPLFAGALSISEEELTKKIKLVHNKLLAT